MGAVNNSTASVAGACWPPTSEEAYLQAPTVIFAVAVVSMNSIFAISNIKFNKSMSRLGLVMSTALFINSSLVWLVKVLLFILQEILTDISVYLCVPFGLVCLVSLHFQACLLSAIAHDRAQLICTSLVHHDFLVQQRLLVMLFACLAAPLLIIVPALGSPEVFCFDSILGICIGDIKCRNASILALVGLLAAVLQWSCVVWYIVSYARIWRAAKHVTRHPGSSSSRAERRTALRTPAVLGAQYILFVIAPNIIGMVMYYLVADFGVRVWLYKGMLFAFAGNYIVAPVVYVCFDRSVKAALRKDLLRCKRRLKSATCGAGSMTQRSAQR